MKIKLLLALLMTVFKTTVAQQQLVLKFDHKKVEDSSITLTRWKYYISQVQLTGTHNVEVKEPFLVDAFLQDSVLLSIPPGKYKAIEFWVGIDSLTNTKGIQEGALDPMSGMYWTWNTGYINWKVEGRKRQNDSLMRITHHIGGFLPPFKAIRKVRLEFDREHSIQGFKNNRIFIAVNLNDYLAKTSHHQNIMEPCKEALLVADAIPATFSLLAVNTD